MLPKNGHSEKGKSKDYPKFKKKGKKLDNYEKQKPKYKNQIFDSLDDEFDDTIRGGIKTSRKDILEDEDDYEE